MTIQSFFQLVELPTKAASVLPFLLGSFYGFSLFRRWNGLTFGVMLVSLLCLDMATTLLNNWMDFRRARVRDGYNYSQHNALAAYSLPELQVGWTFALLVLIGVLSGLYLVSLTDYWVLVFGIICFMTGMAYSWGPLPVSHTPLGEVASATVMGFIIPTLAAMVQLPPSYFLVLRADSEWLALHLRWNDLAPLLLLAWPLAAGIANVMLANNICDRLEDQRNGRRTLPVVLGEGPSRWLFLFTSVLAFLGQPLGMMLGMFKWESAIFFVMTIPVLGLAFRFVRHPDKATTFRFAVRNLFLLGGAQTLLVALGFVV